MPKVSVAMGVYNDVGRVDRSIQSILSQSYGDFEFIICDDGSTDGSYDKLLDWAQKDARIRVLKNQANMTLAPTLNNCIKVATGEYVARMDSDDVAHPDRFARQIAFLDAHPECAVVGSSVILFDEGGPWGSRKSNPSPTKKDFLRGNQFAHPTTMFRRDVLLALGGYRTDKAFQRVEDYDLFLRLYAAGYRGYNLEASLLDYYESRYSRGRKKYRYRINAAHVRYLGYRALHLMPAGLFFAMKPLIVGLIPYEWLLQYHKKKYKLKPEAMPAAASVRVLQILSSTQRTGGVETMVMNVYRNIDRQRVQFDFVSHLQGPSDFNDEMLKMGAKVFEIPLVTEIGYRRYKKELREIIRGGQYRAVHTHLDSPGWIGALCAKKEGVPVRICHAHLDHSADKSLRTLVRLSLARLLAPRFATGLCSCSEAAARSVFGDRPVRDRKVTLIHNGVDVEKFTAELEDGQRTAYNDEFGITKKRIILHAARVADVKNHAFLLDVVALAKKQGLPWFFFCVGDGPLMEQMKERIHVESLEDHVRFIGSRADMPQLLQLADALVLPSLMEGLPVVLVEAHAAGVPMVVSDAVTKDADFGLGLMQFIPINQGAEIWIAPLSKALEMPRPGKEIRLEQIKKLGFDIKQSCSQLLDLYQN